MATAVRLAQLREQRKRSQVAQAREMRVSQSRISQIENAPDLYLSTLAEYVAALDGCLRLFAEFDDETVELTLPTAARSARPSVENDEARPAIVS